MQKSQRSLMRSAKQQKRKQKLFALCNNNNPINYRRLPSLPLLELRTLKLMDYRWFSLRLLAPHQANQEAWLRLYVPSLSGSEANGEKGTNKKKKKKSNLPILIIGSQKWICGMEFGEDKVCLQDRK